MSCEPCEKAQGEGQVAFFRWGKANILLSGCREHLREVLAALRDVIEIEGNAVAK